MTSLKSVKITLDIFGKKDIWIAMDLTVLENTWFIDRLVFHIETEETTNYSPKNISLKYLPNTKIYRIPNIVSLESCLLIIILLLYLGGISSPVL